jgi:hypothetical protein
MAGDTTLNNLLGTPPAGYSKSIYYERAPQGAAFPYVIFNKQAGTPRYAMGSRAFDNDVWLIKGVDRSETADAVDNIAARLDALLTDGSISIASRTQLYLRRESDLNFPETTDGVNYRHAGSLYRLLYE